ncbi:MAG: hypothetical protein IKM30_07290 [Oscillospiraceae bacterium]|nr:hypothetical protein [Oscillospiraceae bacterium]
MVKTKGIRLLAASLAAALSVSAMSTAAFSVNAAEDSLLILGDSISAGYGLSEGEYGYYDYLGECMDLTVTNMAVSGAQTSHLLELIDESATQDAIKDADLIAISIGANDLLTPFRAFLDAKLKEGEDYIDLFYRLEAEGTLVAQMAQLTGYLSDFIEAAKVNLSEIETQIRALNPDAPLVMQTIYNPAEFYTTEYNGVDYAETYGMLSRYLKNMLSRVNGHMAELETVTVADVMAAYEGTGWLYVRIREKDVHPTVLGHALIAAVIMDSLEFRGGTSEQIQVVLDGLSASDAKTLPEDDRALLMQYVSSAVPYRLGDVTGDAVINANDATMVLMHYLEESILNKGPKLTGKSFTAGDINEDGKLLVKDAQMILQYYAVSITGGTPSWEKILEMYQ